MHGQHLAAELGQDVPGETPPARVLDEAQVLVQGRDVVHAEDVTGGLSPQGFGVAGKRLRSGDGETREGKISRRPQLGTR